MKIGQRIKQRRKELKISADKLAEILNVSRSTIFRYESGYIEKVPLDILEPIAQALQTTPSYLMGWEEPAQKTKNKGDMTIGDVIRNLRLGRQLSLVEFSEEVGISASDLRNYENGTKQITAHIMTVMAHAFGMEPTELTQMFLNADKDTDTKPDHIYVTHVKSWYEEFGPNAFTEDELMQIFQFARFLISNRKK